jgi:hypothetical protein
MLFLLATPEYTNVQSNTTKVKVHLRNGVAEVFNLHQDLMGRVDNDIVEIKLSKLRENIINNKNATLNNILICFIITIYFIMFILL